MRLASLLPWRAKDPYWDAFVNRLPADPANLVPPAIRNAPEGAVFPVKSDVHTPEVMTEHIRDLGRFFSAALVGVARLDPAGDSEYPYAIVCGIASEYDPRVSPGIGGQAAALTGAYVAFNIAAAVREYGFRATRKGGEHIDLDRLAVCAGLGALDREGRLTTPEHGRKLYLADTIRTDLPLKPGTEETYEWARPTS
jgi:hypothetical protein